MKDSVIRKANMSGDFFIIGDVNAMLLTKLKGVQYTREAIEEVVSAVDCSNFIMNLKKEELINLFFN